MPARDVWTIRDLIFYQYAKIITRAMLSRRKTTAPGGSHYGFITSTFRKLRSGEMSWSDVTREDWQLVDSEKCCAYCGATEALQKEHIIRKSLQLTPDCQSCHTTQGIHNQVWACGPCNQSKGTDGLYTFFRKRHPEDKKFYDRVPPLVEKKYLKLAFNCHQCAGTLEATDIDGDAVIGVSDIDYVFTKKFARTADRGAVPTIE